MKNLFSPLIEEVNLGETHSPVNSWHAIKKMLQFSKILVVKLVPC